MPARARCPALGLHCNKPSGAPFASRPTDLPSMTVRALVLALAVTSLSACGGSRATVSSAQEAFDRGTVALEARKHDRAVELFRSALDFGRTTEIADDAQLGLARAYRGDKQYLLAGAEYTRFIEFYRTDPRVSEAAYERILAYAALSPSFELDQTDTEQTIAYIRLFLQQYGATSEYATEVAGLLDTFQEKLARKQYEGGRLYERRELFEAAAIAYAGVLEQYPASAVADEAMLGRIRALTSYAANSIPSKQVTRYRDALRLYDQFVTLFPASPLVADAETEYDRAYRGYIAAGGAPEDAQASN